MGNDMVVRNEQYLLKVSWIAEDKNKDRNLLRCQYFGPFDKEACDEKIEFYRYKARYGSHKKLFEVFPAKRTKAFLVDKDGKFNQQ